MASAKYRVKKRRKSSKSKTKYLFLLLFLVLVGVLSFFAYKKILKPRDTFGSSKYLVKGIDVSHHNPILNWDIVVEQGISFTYMKATEGTTHIDRNYRYNYKPARSINVKVGSYHFYSFGVSGKEQAKHFIKNASFNSGDLIPAIDVEHSPANLFSKDDKYVALVVSELKVLENELYEHFAVHPLIYTNRDCYKLYVKGNFPNNLIWMCDLDKEPADDIPWKIWQFSHKGKLEGVSGNFDLNYFRYSFKDLKELLLP